MTKKIFWIIVIAISFVEIMLFYLLEWDTMKWITGTSIPFFISVIIFLGLRIESNRIILTYFILMIFSSLIFGVLLLLGLQNYELIGFSLSIGGILFGVVSFRIVMFDIYKRQFNNIKKTLYSNIILPKKIIEVISSSMLLLLFQVYMLIPILFGIFVMTSPKISIDIGQQFWDGDRTQTKGLPIIWQSNENNVDVKNRPSKNSIIIGKVPSSKTVLRIDLVGIEDSSFIINHYCPVLTLTFLEKPIVGWVETTFLKADDNSTDMNLSMIFLFFGTIFNLVSLKDAFIEASIGFAIAISISFFNKRLKEYLGLITSLIAMSISVLPYTERLNDILLFTKIYTYFFFPQVVVFPWLLSILYVKFFKWIGIKLVREDDVAPL